MDNIYYQSQIEYNFIKKLSTILDLQYEEYKKQIIKIILQELDDKNNKLLKNN